MKGKDPTVAEGADAEIHRPLEHVQLWADVTIKLLAGTPDGGPVEMDAVEASKVADLLREFSEPDFADIPYEPGSTPYGLLMHDVCVEWGFCGCVREGRLLHVDFIIPREGPVTADQFVEWVFLADNLNPNHEPERWERHKDAIRAAFVKHMGAETVDARTLRWEIEPDPSPHVKWRGPLPEAR
jgi:hypothetical protein